MTIKKKIFLLSTAIGISAVAVPSISVLNNIQKNNAIVSVDKWAQSNQTTASYTHYYSQGSMETITNINGPILLKDEGKKVVSMDWYGNINWEYTISDLDSSSTKVVDWNYMDSHDWLYLITDKSFIIKIISTNGSIAGRADATTSGVPSNANKLATISFNNSLYVWNSSESAPKAVQIDRNTLKKVESSNDSIKATSDYLVDILPIAVGYNIGVFSNVAVSDTIQTSTATITLKFIDDNLKEITGPTPKQVTSKSTNTTFKDFATYSFQRSQNTTSPLIIIDKTPYSITLNKTDMASSAINDITISAGNTINNNWINSAFMDENDTVYFKTYGETKIYSITYNNIWTVHTDLNSDNNTVLKNIVTKPNNNVQIFGVAESGKAQNSQFGYKRKYTQDLMLITSSENNYITGMKAKKVESTDYSSMKPGISLKAGNRISDNLPSVITASDFNSNNADSIVGNNVVFKANDLTGELTVKATLTKSAWYDNKQKTTSIITSYYNKDTPQKPKKLSDLVSWATDTSFYTQFGKYTPGQLVESDLNNWNGLIKRSKMDSVTNFKNLTTNVVITNREDTTGKIKLQGVLSYTDRLNNFISYTLPEKEYTISKSTGKHIIKFYGSTKNAEGTTQNQTAKENDEINMDNVANTEVKDLQKYLPSMISWDKLPMFLEKEESYIPSHRNMVSTYDDDAGTLTIELTYGIIDATKIPNKFIQKYTGFVTNAQASINWKGDDTKDETILSIFGGEGKATPKDITSIGEYNSLGEEVASKVDAKQLGNIYDSKLSRMGINPNISIDELNTEDHEYGSFVVTLDYSGDKTDPTKLKQAYKNRFGLKDFKISQRYSGMLPIGVLYGIELNQNSDKAKRVIEKYDLDSVIPTTDILSTLDIRGYVLDSEDASKNDTLELQEFHWNGEKLEFTVYAQSSKYASVTTNKKFTLDWAPKFKAIRERNMIIAVVVSILGVAIVSTAITLYILRRNRIRRLLK